MLVVALLLCDKRTELVANSCVGRLRENTNIDMINYVHDHPAVV